MEGTMAAPEGRAVRRLGAALALGTVAQALVYRAAPGLGFTALVALLVAATLGAFRTRPTTAVAIPAACALIAAAAVAGRAGTWALAWGVPGATASLGVLVAAAARARRGPEELGGAAVDSALALARAGDAAARAADTGRAVGRVALSGEGRRVALGLLVGAPLALVVLGLLTADRAFAAALRAGARGSFDVAAFGACAVATAVAALFGHDLHAAHAAREASAREADPAGAPRPPYRVPGDAEPPAPPRGLPRLRPSTFVAILAQLGVVLVAFDAVAARRAFAGHAWLNAAGTSTYAGAVHAGFAQVTLAVALVVAVVVAGHARLAPSDRPGAARAVALALLGLAVPALLVSHEHLRLYEEAYGATTLRLGVACAEIGMAGMLAMAALRVGVPHLPGFGGACVAASLAFTAGVAWVNADAAVLARNVARAAPGAVDPRVSTVPLDLGYLGTLSPDALAGAPGDAGPRTCEALRLLVARWDAEAPRDPRERRGLLRARFPPSCE